MSHNDPRNPDSIAMEPTRLDGGRRADLDPPTDPRVVRSTSGNWGLIGGLAAVLVLGLVIFSMMGGQPAGNSTTQTSQPAPAAQPAPDTTTTGSVPRSATPPSGQPAGTTPGVTTTPSPEAPRNQP
jgi:hypothetical protein